MSGAFSLLRHELGVRFKVKGRGTLLHQKLPADSNESGLRPFLASDFRLNETFNLAGHGVLALERSRPPTLNLIPSVMTLEAKYLAQLRI